MAIIKESTAGGKVVLRDTKTGTLAGSIGDGKSRPPTAAGKKAPKAKVKNNVDSISIAKRKFDASKESKVSFMDFKSLPELISYIAEESKVLEKSTRDMGEYLGIVWTEEGISKFLKYSVHPKDNSKMISATDPAFQYQNNLEFLKDSSVSKEALMILGYRHELSQPYPSFMYGSLRPGEYNFKRIFGAKSAGLAAISTNHKLHGLTLYGNKNSHYPYAGATPDDKDSVICGDLITLNTKKNGYITRARLDQTEDFRVTDPDSSHYKRVLNSLTLEDGTETKVWIYVSARQPNRWLKPIKSGDWLTYQGAHLEFTSPEQRDIDLKTPITK